MVKRTKRCRCMRLSFCFIGISVLLFLLADLVPGFATWYSVCLYSRVADAAGWIFGWIPFSVSEILLYACIFGLVPYTVFIIVKKGKISNAMVGILLTASVLLFLYTVNCGVNYHRTPFSATSGIAAEEYRTEELEYVCRVLTKQVNETAEMVQRNERGVMIAGADVGKRASDVMENLSESFPVLRGYYPRAKGILIPWTLSVQKITGIYSPFTIEANYNTGMTAYHIPFTACHELAHLRGFMQEEEANFIAFLACIHTEEVDFQYSGLLRGWISCMNLLYRSDPESWTEIRSQLNLKTEADLQANRLYWEKYDGKTAELAEKVNDAYLKANGQSDGIKSYSRMSDFIVSYYLSSLR